MPVHNIGTCSTMATDPFQFNTVSKPRRVKGALTAIPQTRKGGGQGEQKGDSYVVGSKGSIPEVTRKMRLTFILLHITFFETLPANFIYFFFFLSTSSCGQSETLSCSLPESHCNYHREIKAQNYIKMDPFFPRWFSHDVTDGSTYRNIFMQH